MNVSYPSLNEEAKRMIDINLEARRSRYVLAVLNNSIGCQAKVVIVGDRPGPAAPLAPDYHHTPFYSTRYCSGWLNALLYLEGIDENDLVWLNAYDKDGNPTDYKVLDRILPDRLPQPIIALGGNAAKWLSKGGYGYVQTTHPQFHKRFKNKERYNLPDLIKQFL